jgi:hypothetical protein
MPKEMLSPERAIRLLRAKAHELEVAVSQEALAHGGVQRPVTLLAADIALIATLLADFMERIEDEDGELMQALESRERNFVEGFNEGRPKDGLGFPEARE